MKKIAVMVLMLWFSVESFAQATAYFTGRSQYLGQYRIMCEYEYNGMAFTVIVDGTYCPYSTRI